MCDNVSLYTVVCTHPNFSLRFYKERIFRRFPRAHEVCDSIRPLYIAYLCQSV